MCSFHSASPWRACRRVRPIDIHTFKHPTTGLSVTLNSRKSCACQACQSVYSCLDEPDTLLHPGFLNGPPGLMRPPKMNIFVNPDQVGGRSRSWFGLHQPFDPNYRIVTSDYLHPCTLLGVRVSFAVFCIMTCIIDTVVQVKAGAASWW